MGACSGNKFMIPCRSRPAATRLSAARNLIFRRQADGARLGQVKELGQMHWPHGLYLRNGQEFQVIHGTPDGRRRSPG
jgi:hypothetical protein